MVAAPTRWLVAAAMTVMKRTNGFSSDDERNNNNAGSIAATTTSPGITLLGHHPCISSCIPPSLAIYHIQAVARQLVRGTTSGKGAPGTTATALEVTSLLYQCDASSELPLITDSASERPLCPSVRHLTLRCLSVYRSLILHFPALAPTPNSEMYFTIAALHSVCHCRWPSTPRSLCLVGILLDPQIMPFSPLELLMMHPDPPHCPSLHL
ncbi:hypothetical protein Pelo_18842 [Pelomyxa schiedti]|nr:hypothetical protein Pelo_18842 [Pelomyxa schiedti]